jgi:cysteine synthase
VGSKQALRSLRELTEKEGIFAGISSGAVIHTALRIAERLEEGDIVCLLADGGWKYLSSDAWSADLETAEKQVETTLWW